MLFQTLDKLKRQSILAAILMMALGVVMLICPESYVNTLVVTVGYGMIVFALVEMLEFVASRKALIHYILFTGALIIAILGVFILIYNQDLLKALGWLFGFVLVQDGLLMLVILAVVLLVLGVLIFLNPWWDSPSLLMKVIGGALLFSALVSVLRLIWVWPFKNEKEGAEDAAER